MKNLMKITAAASAALMVAGAASADQITVETNFTKPVSIRGNAASVVIGNQNIADVAVHSPKLLFLTGKTFGTTNLLVYNEAGRLIYETNVTVTTDTASRVSINRAGAIATYDCSPDCETVASIGDDDDYFKGVLDQQKSLKDLSEGE